MLPTTRAVHPSRSLLPSAFSVLFALWVAAMPTASDAGGLGALRFEPNRGQVAPRHDFTGRTSGYALHLNAAEATLDLRGPESSERLHLHFVGGDPAAPPEPLDLLPGTVSYFLGNEPSRWLRGLPTYDRVRYVGVWPGVDVVHRNDGGLLEFDFVLAPGVDASVIGMSFTDDEGQAVPVAVDAAGDLLVHSAAGVVRLPRPVIFQEVAGARRPVDGGYLLGAVEGVAPQVGFQLGSYDPEESVVIDPKVLFSTYQGGAGLDELNGVAVDGAGAIYVTGTVNALGGGAGMAHVTKLSADGQAVLYEVQFGGFFGAFGRAIDVAPNGTVVVTGTTFSDDFPAVNPVQGPGGGNDAWVARLSPQADLVFSTHLGGTYGERPIAIAIDAFDRIHVMGWTYALDFPTTSGAYQASYAGGASGVGDDLFFTRFRANDTVAYSSYLGGTDDEDPGDLVVLPDGTTWVSGRSTSVDFPVTVGTPPDEALTYGNQVYWKVGPTGTTELVRVAEPRRDGSIPRLAVSSNGQLLMADNGYIHIMDASGEILAASESLCPLTDLVEGPKGKIHFACTNDHPAAWGPLHGLQPYAGDKDLMVGRLSEELQLEFLTFFGGEERELPGDIAVGPLGRPVVASSTESGDYPTKDPLFTVPSPGSSRDGCITKFTGYGELGEAAWITHAEPASLSGVRPIDLPSLSGLVDRALPRRSRLSSVPRRGATSRRTRGVGHARGRRPRVGHRRGDAGDPRFRGGGRPTLRHRLPPRGWARLRRPSRRRPGLWRVEGDGDRPGDENRRRDDRAGDPAGARRADGTGHVPHGTRALRHPSHGGLPVGHRHGHSRGGGNREPRSRCGVGPHRRGRES